MNSDLTYKIEQIKKKFNIGSKESLFPDYPDDLLKLVFFSIKTEKYDTTSDNLEFLGDRVLKIIHGNLAFQYEKNAGDMTKFVQQLEKNETLNNYMMYGIGEKDTNICELLNITGMKPCADIFESFIGSLYYYYNDIEKIIKWLNVNTIFLTHIQHIKENDFFTHIKQEFIEKHYINKNKKLSG